MPRSRSSPSSGSNSKAACRSPGNGPAASPDCAASRSRSRCCARPTGHGRIELSRFDAPAIAGDHRAAPVNALGYLRVMFAVDDLADTLARLGRLGATVVDEVVDYEGIYRLCYLRGPEGILIGLAQQLGREAGRVDPTAPRR